MTSTKDGAATPGDPVATRRPRRHRRHTGRVERVTTKIDRGAWRRVEARAERAGWSLGSWMVLLAADVALGRPVVGESVLEDLAAARIRVARLGSAINAMAARENRGIAVDDGELRAVLDSLAVRCGQAAEAVAAARDVFDGGPGGGGEGAEVAGPAVGRRGREAARRDKQIRAQLTPAERGLLVGAAGRDGLSVGAWLGQLLEDPQVSRPLTGEVWGAVFAVRKAARAAATNLAQIADARAARGAGVPAGVAAAQGQLEALIRACLAAQTVIGAGFRSGSA